MEALFQADERLRVDSDSAAHPLGPQNNGSIPAGLEMLLTWCLEFTLKPSSAHPNLHNVLLLSTMTTATLVRNLRSRRSFSLCIVSAAFGVA